ncbi:hypothetical protein [Pararobbsia silviterrae]|uniref:Uncharacterized protein n=1 Tax=Pararobbsia silviterrae TaxID=1792498 RepID=A0A494Y3B2_9BURK|nr:hypothetical protein [Pararobbsia silviterrae]RKP54812.1 hypothetical protein D7S86_14355 [Pararobbsia silviterrae]
MARRLDGAPAHAGLASPASPTRRVAWTSRRVFAGASLIALGVLALGAGLGGCAASASSANAPGAPLPPPSVTLHSNPAFASLPRYEGTLGKRAIVLHLGQKTDPDDAGGLHGEYMFRDTGQVVLVAGDAGEGVVELDESDDGTRISGQWVGKLTPDGRFNGVWSNVDESVTETIDLHRVPVSPAAP